MVKELSPKQVKGCRIQAFQYVRKTNGEKATSSCRQPGGCPRIAIFFQIKAFLKNKHSHLVDITSIIFQNNAELGKRAFSDSLLGKPTRKPGSDLIGKVWEVWKIDMASNR